MKIVLKKIIFILTSIVISTVVWADNELSVSILSSQLQSSTNLGKVIVDGAGDVNLIARKNGNQIVIHAQDHDGNAIGKAETVAGLKETPIYIMSSDGLKKVVIKWGSKKR